ncbi:MAG: AbrB/MazE/SpoVT family DNA-binding domain-containing protein [Candidatus Helarchaeota archaeon]
MNEIVIQKISSNGRIVIPKKWRELLVLKDNNLVELELRGDIIIIKKKNHPLKNIIGLFDDLDEFSDEDFKDAKRSLFQMPIDEK